MDGGDWLGRPRRGRLIGWLVVACIGFLLFAAGGVTTLLIDTGVIRSASAHPGVRETIDMIVLLGLAAACAAWAVHCEHRLRGLPPGRLAVVAGTAHDMAAHDMAAHAGTPASWRVPRRRRYGPTSTIISGAVFAVLGLILIPVTFSAHATAEKSSYTQSSGVPDNAIVTSVDNQKSCNQNTCDRYYAHVSATLSRPVGGATATTVNIPRNVSYRSGQVISVLVDPKDPGYAELPGSPYTNDSDTIALGVAAAFFFLVGAFVVACGVRARQWRHSWHHLRPV